MTYSQPFLRLSFLFLCTGTDEIAETSLHIAGAPSYDHQDAFNDIDGSILNTLGDYLKNDVLDTTDVSWADYSVLSTMKIAHLGTDGKYLEDAKVHTQSTQYSGNASDVIPQSSLVISLWSGQVTGEANYGRMYLPHTGTYLDTTSPYIKYPTVIGGYYHTFIGHINGVLLAMGTPTQVVLCSKKGTGTQKNVAYTRSGQIVDTQRRRYAQLNVGYANTAV